MKRTKPFSMPPFPRAFPPSRAFHLSRVPIQPRRFSTSPTHFKSCIVTGSSRGIGKAIALRLAQDGYDVCVNDVPANDAGAHEVCREIQAMGRKSTVALADVSKYAEVEGMVAKSVKELGDLDTM